MTGGAGTKGDPWRLKTPPLTSEYEMYVEERDGREVLVCVVGKTTLLYDRRAIDDLHAMLVERGDWIDLGSADAPVLQLFVHSSVNRPSRTIECPDHGDGGDHAVPEPNLTRLADERRADDLVPRRRTLCTSCSAFGAVAT